MHQGRIWTSVTMPKRRNMTDLGGSYAIPKQAHTSASTIVSPSAAEEWPALKMCSGGSFAERKPSSVT
ncbi:hypothetical protein PG985_003816 [Apiospora marii]|uniref:Uncharacterized protein n=1 Tax=Apiospora marii TaxID=335849 RepID=A0ABR1SH62_9PEZI